jgi:cytochrome b561
VASGPVAATDIDRYDRVAQAIHWLVAVLAGVVVALGVAIPATARGSSTRVEVLLLHRSLGLVILALMLFRIAWRLRSPPPPFPLGFPRIDAAAARADHALLYVIFLVMPLSGYIGAAAAGHAVSFFGLVAIPPLLPPNYRLSQFAEAGHLAAQFALYALVGLHIAATMIHHIKGRHRILERMLPPPDLRS